MTTKRSYGSGSIFAAHGASYGKWRLDDRQVKRKLGPIRAPGTRDGLTRTQAEAELRRLIAEVTILAPTERLTFSEVADRYLEHLEHVAGRKRATTQDYRIMLRRHFAPRFGQTPVERIRPQDIAAYIVAARGTGLALNTVTNHLNFAHGVFGFAVKRGWAPSNPVVAVDRPRAPRTDPDIRYLDREELESLLRAAARDDVLGPTDAVLFLTAATTGLRQGELAALRWRDVDWPAGVVRVRRSYSRGEWGTPKSRRSSRAVPLPDRTAAELDRHFQRSVYRGDDELVFCHPQSGGPYDASRMRKRFYEAMRAAGMADRCGRSGGITFHSLRHTFGTRMAAVGVPMRTVQEWMGHRDFTTTLVYADFAPDPTGGAAFAQLAFGGAATPLEDTATPEPRAGPGLAS